MLASVHCSWLGGEGRAPRNHWTLLRKKCRERHVATTDISNINSDQASGRLDRPSIVGRLDGEDLEVGLAPSMSEEVHFFEDRRQALPPWNPRSATSCHAYIRP